MGQKNLLDKLDQLQNQVPWMLWCNFFYVDGVGWLSCMMMMMMMMMMLMMMIMMFFFVCLCVQVRFQDLLPAGCNKQIHSSSHNFYVVTITMTAMWYISTSVFQSLMPFADFWVRHVRSDMYNNQDKTNKLQAGEGRSWTWKATFQLPVIFLRGDYIMIITKWFEGFKKYHKHSQTNNEQFQVSIP